MDSNKITPDSLDKMVSVIEIKAWVTLFAVLIILGATVLWGFFGTMQIRDDAQGVLIKRGKVFNIFAADDSILLDFPIKAEQYVERDQVVARLEQIDLITEINLLIAQNAPDIEIETKREELISKSQIKTPNSGRVVEIFARPGDYVSKGTKLATLSSEAKETIAQECLLFLPAGKIKNIKKGMTVNVYPASISKNEYGNMFGTITYISEYPVTTQYMIDTLGSEELANEFLDDGALYELHVNLVPSEETTTGYKWTTSYGPNIKFGNITLFDASIVVSELRPIDVFFLEE